MAEEQAVQAVSDGNLTLLHQLDLSSFINEQFRNKTLLYLACKKGFLEIVRFLFTVHGIDVNKGCRENFFNRHSPLWISCNKGHLEIVKFLLEKNAQIGNDEREAFKDVKEKFALDLDLDELKEQVIRQISRQTETLRADQVRIQELEAMIRNLNSKLEQESAEKEQQLLEKDEIIQHLAEKNNDLNNILEHRWKQEEISIEFPSIKQVFNTSQKDIHIIKKELNRIDQQLYEIINKGLLIEENEFNQLIQERNKLRSEIVVKYSYNIFELETEKKNLHDKLNRLETTIREYQYYQEIFKNIQTNSNKETLLKSLSSIKLEIEELELSKDELSVEIRKQQRGKKATPQEISNLEKKLGEMCENLTHLNERQSEIQQSLSLLIPKFPEIIIEMKKILSVEQSNTSTKIMSPEEKFKLFALQNSILLTTSLSEYSNRTVLHTGLSVVYKATKSNKQIVILKEISITDTNCDTVMNEIMNIWRLKGHSRIIKLNGVFIESQFNKVYIETPYYSNGNLLEYINKIRSEHDSPTLKNMLRVIFRKVTETLQFIHSKEILHRDLKPQNILVNENGEPIIADFGSSKKLIAQLTNNTMGVGTLKYMALEVRRQEVPPSEKSDIWSLGVSLFECWKLIHNEQQGDLMTCSAADILNFDIDGNVVLPEKNLNFESDIMLMKLLKETFAINPDDRPSALTILTNEEYFTLDNAISTDLLSRSNQDLDNSERISLWQARLKKLKELSIQPNDIQFRNIRRIVLLDDISSVVEKVMKEKDICLIFNKTKVRFDEEGGIDAGGLSNELFSKYVEAMLLESNLFQKSDTSSIENFILTDTPLTEKSKSYLRTFGWLLKKLLIDSDDKTVYLPLNSFIFYYLLNGDIFKNQTVPMNDIILTLSKFLREYDFELDNQIMNMEKCKNDMELQSITYEETFVDVLSKSEKPLIMENVQLFILSQLYSYFYTSEKIEKIKLIKEGFDFFNLKQLKKSTSYSNRPLKEFLELQGSDFNERNLSVNELKILLSGQSYIDADLVLNEMTFSYLNQNSKDFFITCVRKLSKSQLRQLLVWTTALSSIPIRGFSRKISIRESTRFEAHTCSFSFDIPTQISDFNAFETLFMNCLRLSSVSTMED